MNRPLQTLLLIEDSLLQRARYCRYLLADELCSYRLLEADSAVAGLELVLTGSVDAVLLAGELPDANGLEVLEALQAQDVTPRPPVVMVAEQADGPSEIAISSAIRAIKLGAEDYLLNHQLTPETLQIAMRSAIETARLRQQLKQSDDRFRVSIENMLDCFGIYSAIRDEAGQIVDFRFNYLNAAAMESNAMMPADMSKSLGEMFPAYYTAGLFEDYCRVVETGEPLIKEDLIYSDVFKGRTLTRAYDVRANKLGDGFVAAWRDVTERKQAEFELQAANRQITTIWESMSEAYITLDCEWRIAYANSAAIQVVRQLSGLEPEDFLGRVHWEVFPWSVGQRIEQEYRRAMAEQVAVHFDMLYEPSGSWFEIHAYPSSVGLGIYFRDIGDRIRNEQDRNEAIRKLQVQTELLQLIINSVGDGLILANPQGEFVLFNQAAEQMFGRLDNERSHDEWSQTYGLFLPDQQTLFPEQQLPLYRAIHGDLVTDVEVFVRRDLSLPGRWVSISGFPVSDRIGEITGGVITCRDVTERKQSEATMQRQLAQIEAIYATAPIGLCFLDRERRFVQLNERLAEINGLSVAAHLGRTLREILPELAQVQEPIFEQVMQTGEPVLDVEVQGITPAQPGVERYWSVSYYPLIAAGTTTTDTITADKQVLGINIMVQEITERKRAELERSQLLAEAQAAREEAEAANRSKDGFVAMVAHELRSPLNSVMGWAKLLQTRRFDEAAVARALDTIVRNTEAQVQLVEDLLDMSRMVRGTLQIQMAPVNWASVIEAALEAVRPMAEAKQIQLAAQFVLVPQVSGDFNRLQQIAVNLLTNAIKFTPSQGRVELYLESVEAEVEAQAEAQAQLRVCDTGKGIAADFLPLIFEQFQQGQRSTGAKDGLGLGLAIVKNLVNLHQGTIAAHSPGLGQGATFTVRLPMLDAIAQSNLPPVSNGEASLAGVRILLVDDEPDMLELISFVLKESGAEVQCAASLAEALAHLIPFKPDILLSDISMPGGNGYELVQQMRSLPEGIIPAIAMTAYASATYEERSLQAGFDHHFTKPVEAEDLIAAILNLVNAGNRPN
jgi:PAS domain S-box-containing protein